MPRVSKTSLPIRFSEGATTSRYMLSHSAHGSSLTPGCGPDPVMDVIGHAMVKDERVEGLEGFMANPIFG